MCRNIRLYQSNYLNWVGPFVDLNNCLLKCIFCVLHWFDILLCKLTIFPVFYFLFLSGSISLFPFPYLLLMLFCLFVCLHNLEGALCFFWLSNVMLVSERCSSSCLFCSILLLLFLLNSHVLIHYIKLQVS